MTRVLTGFVLLCVLAFSAKAQSSAGVKTDLNLMNFYVNDTCNLTSSMKAGGSAGFFYKYVYAENTAIEIDVMFHYRTSKIKNRTTGETAEYRYHGIELPVYSIKQIDAGQGLLYLGVGSFASVGFFSRYEAADRMIDLYKKDRTNGKTMMYRWDFGAGFIIGYELKCHLQFNFNYQLGFRNMFDESFGNVWMSSNLIGLGVGYRF
ncbi:MAG: PorT family protein [Tannerella sp.]|jgi:hypothetical protein|nr:PorT family protein [Tannerella sp.]